MIQTILATKFREDLTDCMKTTFPVTSPIFVGVYGVSGKRGCLFPSERLSLTCSGHGLKKMTAGGLLQERPEGHSLYAFL